jgi:hypothetical protein
VYNINGDWGLGIGDWALRIADCGLRIADCGLRIQGTRDWGLSTYT